MGFFSYFWMDRIRQGEAGVFGWYVFKCFLLPLFFGRVRGETRERLANTGNLQV